MKEKGTIKKLLILFGMLAFVLVGVLGYSNETQAASKQSYKIKGQKITLSVKKNTDITATLDAALKAAAEKATSKKPMTVIVPKGTYKINEKGLHIYSNTTLDLSKGVTLKYSGKKSHPMLMTGTNGSYKGKSDYNNSSLCKGYKGFKNITVKGGKWVSTKKNTSNIMRLFHATNITLDGVTLSGGGGVHQVEVAAINGFYVKDCTFKDFGDYSAKNTKKQEALQMDIPCSEEVYPSTYQDGTVMKNVEITGCTFSNVPRGVGTHTLLNGAYFTNIKINNNTFKNIAEEAIVGLNYVNCEIKNNTIKNCGGGILFQFFKATPESITTTIFDGKKAYKGKIKHDAKTVISGNTIVTKYTKTCDEVQGIKIYGLNFKESAKGRDGKKIPKGNYYISNVTVENNNITTAGYGIHMMDTRDCVVRNNTIVGKGVVSSDPKKDKYDGIIVENYAKNTSVTGNTISGMRRNGIFVQVSASLSALENNDISDCKRAGINFFDKSGTTADVTNNVIRNCDTNGIFLSGDCSVPNIVRNTISLADANAGISIFENSTVGKISENTITSTSSGSQMIDTAIKLNDKAKVSEITNNKMIAAGSGKAANTGILILSNSEVTGSLSNNEIGVVGTSAIKLQKSSKVSGSISANTVEEAGATGILVTEKSKVGRDITGNVIKKADKGISLSGSSSVGGSIYGNTITNCRKEVSVDSSSQATVNQ